MLFDAQGPNPDMDEVFKHYAEALRIDPKHKGAHEYMGEAYLQMNDLARAKEHLAALDKICFFACEEYHRPQEGSRGVRSEAKALML